MGVVGQASSSAWSAATIGLRNRSRPTSVPMRLKQKEDDRSPQGIRFWNNCFNRSKFWNRAAGDPLSSETSLASSNTIHQAQSSNMAVDSTRRYSKHKAHRNSTQPAPGGGNVESKDGGLGHVMYSRLVEFSTDNLQRVALDLQRACHDLEQDRSKADRFDASLVERSLSNITRAYVDELGAVVRSDDDNSVRLQLYRDLSLDLYRYWELIARSQYRDCVVCGQGKSLESFSTGVTKSCRHENTTCRRCLATWTATQMETQGWNKIKCPECPQLLHREDMKRAARKEVYER